MGGLRADPARVRAHVGGAALAAAAGVYLTSPPLTSPLLVVAIAVFCLSPLLGGTSRPSRLLLALFATITGSAWVAAAVSLLSDGNAGQTAWLALLTTVLMPLAWVRDPKPIFQWLTPVWLVQAGVSLYQWLFTSATRVNGIAENTNAGAAFLLLGCVYLMNGNTRLKWLILPLVAALPFTGSRWVAVVAALVVVGLFTRRYIDWRYIAVGIACTLALVLIVGWEDIYTTFRRPSTLEIHMYGHRANATVQPDNPMAEFSGPSWTPRGFWDSGIHIVPWRMMHETGILSGLAWVAATGYGLWKIPRRDYRWWLLLTVGLLSGMYYFMWIGPLGWAWWLLVRSERRGQSQ